MKLGEYPFDRVQIACEKCGRAGAYQKRALLQRYGADIELPDLLKAVAADCPRQALQSVAMEPCGAIFPDLRMQR